MKTPLTLQHHYLDSLPSLFYTKQEPEPVKQSELLLFNDALATKLGLDSAALRKIPAYFSGNAVPQGAMPIAQAYSGHQFGYFTRLGDGRAILLGEWETKDKTLYDIQLKGSGRTPYSRSGDGRATVSSMLREYLISEAMAALHIPTTRSLAVTLTGERVFRKYALPGAVLTRVAKSHIRVGTFQYAYEVGGNAAVKELADYTIQRHYPHIARVARPYLSLLEEFVKVQAKLIAKWMSVGFIHGVMNTDNMSLSGETIDYGPCAFLDEYDPATVFSSIDSGGRYAYGNQPSIALWDLTRFAEILVTIIADNGEGDISQIETILLSFQKEYEAAYQKEMAGKLGIFDPHSKDSALITELLRWTHRNKADYTNTFYALTIRDYKAISEESEPKFNAWKQKWLARLDAQVQSKDEARFLMKRSNPVVIPRNHLVEHALAAAEEEGDMTAFLELLTLLQAPYNYDETIPKKFRSPMPEVERRSYRTYCGT